MQKGKVYRIYPNNEQKIVFEKHFGSCRFVYNHLFDIKKTLYDLYEINISEFDLNGCLPYIKERFDWLNDVHAAALQQINKNLHNAFKNFFEGRAKYPTKKTKKGNYFSYRLPQYYKINLTTEQIYIPKIGWIKIKLHRELFDFDFFINHIQITKKNDDIIVEQAKNSKYLKAITISKTPAGKYFVSILTDDQKEMLAKQVFTEDTTIGIDLGLKSFAVTSNGEVIDNPKYLRNSTKKLVKLQRSVSRKVKGSNNRKKAVKKLAKLHEKISNQRHDLQHKLSLRFVRENQAIALETLNIEGMLQNHKLAKAISDASWSSFVSKICYKADWFGKTVLRIDTFVPSSKTCHVCGSKKVDLTLKDREWTCTECKSHHDRDINAAINIKQMALDVLQLFNKISPVERRKELEDSFSGEKGMNQEFLRFLSKDSSHRYTS